MFKESEVFLFQKWSSADKVFSDRYTSIDRFQPVEVK